MLKTFTLDEKLAEGERYEALLDRYYRRWFTIEKVSRSLQRNGVDRIFCDSMGRTFLVEYKADSVAGTTHNAFIETVSIDREQTKGWILKTWAQLIAYYVPPTGLLLLLNTAAIKSALPNWSKRFRLAKSGLSVTRMGEYRSHGLLVPLRELKAHAVKIVTLSASAYEQDSIEAGEP